MTLDRHGAERDRRDRDLQAALMAGVPDRHRRVARLQGRDRAEVRLLRRKWVGRGGVQHHQILDAQDGYGRVDLVERRHAGREDDRLARRREGLEHLDIRHRGRRHLVGHDVEVFEEVD